MDEHVILASKEELEIIEQITRSKVFHGSETLCRLLRYLAERSHEDTRAVKEFRIATEVFGRKDDFDPRFDSTVRVQVARLRMKLHEYSLTEGAQDRYVVSIPRGAYRLSFTPNHGLKGAQRRPAVEHEEQELEPQHPVLNHAQDAVSVPEPVAPPRPGIWRYATLVLAVLLVGATIALIVVWQRAIRTPATAARSTADPALRAFWGSFLPPNDETWVVFSNANFIGRPDSGMRYYRPHQDSPSAITQDHYTGVGEVLSVHELDSTFHALGAQLRVKRGALLSMDDVNKTTIVFVGAPVENLALNDISTTRFYRFRRIADGPRRGDNEILNFHPQLGEPATYINAAEHPITDDYAIIARLPGLAPNRGIVIAAGTTTIGTQAAVEFICHPETLRVLLKMLGSGNESKPFEALLHTKVARGVPIASEIVSFHRVPEN